MHFLPVILKNSVKMDISLLNISKWPVEEKVEMVMRFLKSNLVYFVFVFFCSEDETT